MTRMSLTNIDVVEDIARQLRSAVAALGDMEAKGFVDDLDGLLDGLQEAAERLEVGVENERIDRALMDAMAKAGGYPRPEAMMGDARNRFNLMATYVREVAQWLLAEQAYKLGLAYFQAGKVADSLVPEEPVTIDGLETPEEHRERAKSVVGYMKAAEHGTYLLQDGDPDSKPLPPRNVGKPQRYVGPALIETPDYLEPSEYIEEDEEPKRVVPVEVVPASLFATIEEVPNGVPFVPKAQKNEDRSFWIKEEGIVLFVGPDPDTGQRQPRNAFGMRTEIQMNELAPFRALLPFEFVSVWETLEDVPNGVQFVHDDDRGGYAGRYVKRQGQLYRVRRDNPDQALPDSAVKDCAPFRHYHEWDEEIVRVK